MITTRDGKMMFDDIYELNYELLTEMEMNVDDYGYIHDNNGNILNFNGLRIKASISKDKINYPGQNEIDLDLINNIKIVTDLLGYYIERRSASTDPEEHINFLSYFQTDIDDNESDVKYSYLTIKYDAVNSISSNFYHNRCLKFIDLIFKMNDDDVDLSNFDIIEEK